MTAETLSCSAARVVREHFVALVFALAVGLIFVAPDITLSLTQDRPFTPLTTSTTYNLDECVYGALFRDFYDGHLEINDPYLYEYKKHANPYGRSNQLPALVLTVLAWLTGSMARAFTVASFLFPCLTFLLAYTLVFRWSASRSAALVSATAMLTVVQIVNPTLMLDPQYLRDLAPAVRAGAKNPLYHFNSFARIPAISFNFIPTLLAILLCGEALRQRSIRLGVYAGLCLGALFYTYFYHWTLLCAAIGITAVLLPLRRPAREVLPLALTLGTALAIGSWYLATSILFQYGPHAQDVMRRIGVEPSHLANPNTWRYLPFALVPMVVGLIVSRHVELLLLGSTVAAAMILANLQVAVGQLVQNGHYLPRGVDPLCILIAGLLVGLLSRRSRPPALAANAARWLSLAVCGALLLYAGCAQASYANNTAGQQSLDPAQAALYDWLDHNTRRDDVVLGLSVEDALLVPVYTRDNVYLPMGWATNAPDAELEDRLLTAFRLYGVPAPRLQRLLSLDNAWFDWCTEGERTRYFDRARYEDAAWNMSIFGWKYLYRRESELCAKELPPDVLAKVQRGVPQFYIGPEKRNDLLRRYAANSEEAHRLLGKYRVDYAILGPRERELGTLEHLPWAERCAAFGDIEVYRVR